MDPLYRVKDWEKEYENNRTRELKTMQFVLVPNRMDGDGYTTLVSHDNGAAHFGAWVAILQIASRCDVRGTLMRGCGKPHTPETIGRISRLPAGLCRDAIERLCSDDIAWLEVIDMEDFIKIPQVGAEKPQVGAEKCGLYRTERNGTEGMEKKGTERKEPRADALPWEDPKQIAYLRVAMFNRMAGKWAPPDEAIVKQTLVSAGGASAADVDNAFDLMFKEGKRPAKSWGWFPKMAKEFFGIVKGASE